MTKRLLAAALAAAAVSAAGCGSGSPNSGGAEPRITNPDDGKKGPAVAPVPAAPAAGGNTKAPGAKAGAL